MTTTGVPAPFPIALPTSRVPDPRQAPRLRWGVIGTGWIADRFVTALHRHTDQRVVAVAARDADRAARFAVGHGIDRSHAGPEQLVADAAVDVVYIGTTHPTHLPLALLSLDAGKPTLVEKPLALDAAGAARIEAAARAAGVFCMEAFWTVFLPKFDVIRQLLDDGVLGEVGSVQADHGEWFPDDHRIMDAAEAGGPMLDLGTYPVGFAGWVLGPEALAAARVRAEGRFRADGLHLEIAAVLATARRQLAVLHTTVSGNSPTRASIIGADAALDIGGPFYQPGPFRLHSSDGSRELQYAEPRIAHEALYFQAAEVARCVAAGRTGSELRPLTASIATLTAMDRIRDALGITFDAVG